MPISIRSIVGAAVGVTVLYLLLSTIVLDHFNTTYNYQVTGLSIATTQGLFLLTFVLFLIGIAMSYMGKK